MKSLSFIFIIISLHLLDEAQSYVESEFDLGLFENTEWTKDILKKDIDIVKNLRIWKQQLIKRREAISEIHGYAKRKDNISDSFIDHPVNAYNLIKSHVAVFSKQSSALHSTKDTVKKIMNSIKVITQTNFTRKEDFAGAINGIVVLKDTYRFNEHSFVENDTISIQQLRSTNVNISGYYNFTFEDNIKMADFSIKRMWYDTAIYFARMADLKFKKMKKITNSMKNELTRLKKKLKEINNKRLSKTRSTIDKDWKVLPYMVNSNLSRAKKQLSDTGSIIRINMNTELGREHQFRSVCGEDAMKKLVNISQDTTFKCHFLHHNDPYLKLGPHLLEVVRDSPFVSVFHDIISRKEMENVKTMAKPNLSRKKRKDKPGEFEGKAINIVHQTVSHWFEAVDFYEIDYEEPDTKYNTDNFNITHPTVLKMSKKLEIAVGGINITGGHSSSQFEVTNYGLGGQCQSHVDPYGYWDGVDSGPEINGKIEITGDEFATMMSWIGPEPIGGSTAFPDPFQEFLVHPTEGSMAFWFNLKKSGSRDMRTLHGGCPILKGDKWIMNKWIYYFNQWQDYPCGLSKDEYIPGFSGYYKSI